MTPGAQNPAGAVSPVEQLLAQLQGPALPDAVSAWPPAPGWWVLTLLLTTVVVYALFWAIKRHAQNRYRRVALTSLKRISELSSASQKIDQIKALLKQTFFTAYPTHRNRVAALYGKPWLQELHDTAKLHKLPAAQQNTFERFFSDEIYSPQSNLHDDEALSALVQVAQYWIQNHATKITTPRIDNGAKMIAGGTN